MYLLECRPLKISPHARRYRNLQMSGLVECAPEHSGIACVRPTGIRALRRLGQTARPAQAPGCAAPAGVCQGRGRCMHGAGRGVFRCRGTLQSLSPDPPSVAGWRTPRPNLLLAEFESKVTRTQPAVKSHFPLNLHVDRRESGWQSLNHNRSRRVGPAVTEPAAACRGR